ncbi:MAG: hypothetical protein JJE52_07815 [Acidimicrobiia bacterium]|nr:hypothetical protein [Acidimicrobiia bacterium]
MQGLALLLALAVGGYVALAVTLVARASRRDAERAGYYGRSARRRVEQADEVDSVIADMVTSHRLDDLAELVGTLDRLAWGGVRVAGLRRLGTSDRWRIEFDDGTSLLVGTDDARPLRRAAQLVNRNVVVVSRVRPLEVSAFVELYSTRHGAMHLGIRA